MQSHNGAKVIQICQQLIQLLAENEVVTCYEPCYSYLNQTTSVLWSAAAAVNVQQKLYLASEIADTVVPFTKQSSMAGI